MRTLRLEQVGQLEVGEHATGERLASGHLLFSAGEREHALLLDPTLGRVERLSRWTRAAHAGERLRAELDSEGDVHVLGDDGAELVRIEARGDVGGLRFDASGVVLWELAERRPWEVRARVARDGRLIGRVSLPEPASGAWHIEAVRPVADGLIVSSLFRHLAITLAPAGLALHPLPIEGFVDWLPGARGFVAAEDDQGELGIHRWPDGARVRPVVTDRVSEVLGDHPCWTGRVIDDERAILATLEGRLIVLDLVDPGAQILELRLEGDRASDGLSTVELGRTGRILTGREGARVLKIWDGDEAVRTIPARRRGLR